jgi:hypothetical protein
MPVLVPIAREQEWTLARNCHLVLKCIDSEPGEGHLSDAVRRFRIRYPDDCVLEIYLVLSHRSQFLVDAQTGLGDDPNDVPEIARSVRFDLLLFRPWDVVRPEQTFHRDRELDA